MYTAVVLLARISKAFVYHTVVFFVASPLIAPERHVLNPPPETPTRPAKYSKIHGYPA